MQMCDLHNSTVNLNQMSDLQVRLIWQYQFGNGKDEDAEEDDYFYWKKKKKFCVKNLQIKECKSPLFL